MTTHYILVLGTGVFVKEAEYFKEQGGLDQAWGEAWEPIDAASLYAARRKAIDLRRNRFPRSHRTLGEDEPLDKVWPEARGR